MFSTINVIPQNDVCEHVHGLECSCQPTAKYIEAKLIIEHQAVDGRKDEEGEWRAFLSNWKESRIH